MIVNEVIHECNLGDDRNQGGQKSLLWYTSPAREPEDRPNLCLRGAAAAWLNPPANEACLHTNVDIRCDWTKELATKVGRTIEPVQCRLLGWRPCQAAGVVAALPEFPASVNAAARPTTLHNGPTHCL